jgi:murein DD-endopeptidase MepM/ murein hydrolase activator NlpD
MNSLKEDIQALLKAFLWYVKRKINYFARTFEKFKNFLVTLLMVRRGAAQKHFWHGSMVGLASVGLVTSGVFGGQSLVSATYPGMGDPDPRFTESFEPYPEGVYLDSSQNTHTDFSKKVRSETVDYEVKGGDTISSIAGNFDISQETILWENNMDKGDQIKPGQTIKILPVTGVSYTVKPGDTVDSIAKKFDTEAQNIVDFPFNDVPDDFKLKAGEELIVPNGVRPDSAVPAPKKTQPSYTAQAPSSASFQADGGGSFVWPASYQYISTYFAWWHPGIDLPNRAAPPVAASDGGQVVVAGWPDSYGYGNRVVIDHGNGYTSLYAHLSNIYVSVGQAVSRGQIIGQMGSTGRSTGTHLHFEIHYKGVPVNPLNILK